MNHEHVTLSYLLADKTGTDIAKFNLIIQVIERISERRFVIGDSTRNANIEFEENTLSLAKKLKELKCYRFSGLQKVNSDEISFKNTSFFTEESILQNLTLKRAFLNTKDLLGIPPKTIVQQSVLLKVVSIDDEPIFNKHSIASKSVFLADNHHSLYMIFLGEDVSRVPTLMKEGDVVSIKNVELSNIPDPDYTNKMEPQDFVYRSQYPSTIIQKIDEDKFPEFYIDVLNPLKDVSIQGTIKLFDQIYEYKTCHGKNGTICGEPVHNSSLFCERPSCGVKLNRENLINDYKVKFVVLGPSGIQHFTAFKIILEQFENKDETDIYKKLECLVDAKVVIQISECSNSDDDPSVEELTIVKA